MPLSSATSKTLGFALFGLSTLASVTGLVLPFLAIGLPRKPLWVTGCLVVGELLLPASLVFLGKQYGKRVKLKLLAWIHRTCAWRPGRRKRGRQARNNK